MEKRYCKRCSRPLDWNDNEYCKGCLEDINNGVPYEEIQKKIQEENKNYPNAVANIIKVIAIIGAIIGIIYGCTLLDSSYTEGVAVVYIAVSIVSAIFIYALGEIIQLLEDIKNK